MKKINFQIIVAEVIVSNKTFQVTKYFPFGDMEQLEAFKEDVQKELPEGTNMNVRILSNEEVIELLHEKSI